jgi:hypothetical protein
MSLESFYQTQLDNMFDEEERLIVKEKELHETISLSKEETSSLLNQYSDIKWMESTIIHLNR